MTNYVTLLLSSTGSICLLVNSNISLILLTWSLQSLINIPGKANATLCESHVFVKLEAIKHDSSVSDAAIPRLINLEAAKQICQAKIAVLNVLRHGRSPFYYMYNPIVF